MAGTLHTTLRALSLTPKPTPTTIITTPTHLLQQTRRASVLTNLAPIPSSIRNKKRLGRGPSSGKGKTSGRGHKGQKQHGKVPAGFNGGQSSAEVVHGLRGVQSTYHKVDLRTLNVDRLQFWIDQGRLDPSRMITLRELARTRCLHGLGEGVKLLARNASTVRVPIHVTVSRASKSAIKAIEEAGGSVQTRYYTKASIKRIMKGETHPFLSRLSPGSHTAQPTPADGDVAAMAEPTTEAEAEASPTAPSASAPQSVTEAGALSDYPPPDKFRYRLPDAFNRKDLEYYRDPAHRGYLAYQVEEGAGVSLYFKSPEKLREEVITRKRAKRQRAVGGSERVEDKVDMGRIW